METKVFPKRRYNSTTPGGDILDDVVDSPQVRASYQVGQPERWLKFHEFNLAFRKSQYKVNIFFTLLDVMCKMSYSKISNYQQQ
jgi:hypothetical protein